MDDNKTIMRSLIELIRDLSKFRKELTRLPQRLDDLFQETFSDSSECEQLSTKEALSIIDSYDDGADKALLPFAHHPDVEVRLAVVKKS